MVRERRLSAYDGPLYGVNKNTSSVLTNTYNPDGTRRTLSNGGAINFLYDGQDVLAEYDSSWANPDITYAHGPGIDEPLVMTSWNYAQEPASHTEYYLHHDALGSTRDLTDANENTVTTYSYDAWGKTTESTITGNVSCPFRYTSREWDDAAEMYYYRARYYSPDLGRFISREALKRSDREWLTSFAYATNSPASYTDPSGLSAVQDAIILGGSILDCPQYMDVPLTFSHCWTDYKGQKCYDCCTGVWQAYNILDMYSALKPYLGALISLPKATTEAAVREVVDNVRDKIAQKQLEVLVGGIIKNPPPEVWSKMLRSYNAIGAAGCAFMEKFYPGLVQTLAEHEWDFEQCLANCEDEEDPTDNWIPWFRETQTWDSCHLPASDTRCQSTPKSYCWASQHQGWKGKRCCSQIICCAFCYYSGLPYGQPCDRKDKCCSGEDPGGPAVYWCGDPPSYEETSNVCNLRYPENTYCRPLADTESSPSAILDETSVVTTRLDP